MLPLHQPGVGDRPRHPARQRQFLGIGDRIDPDRPAAAQDLADGEREQARRRAGGHHHVRPLGPHHRDEPAEDARHRQRILAGDIADLIVAHRPEIAVGLRLHADKDQLHPVEGGQDAAHLDPMPPAEQATITFTTRSSRPEAPIRSPHAACRPPRGQRPRTFMLTHGARKGKPGRSPERPGRLEKRQAAASQETSRSGRAGVRWQAWTRNSTSTSAGKSRTGKPGR